MTEPAAPVVPEHMVRAPVWRLAGLDIARGLAVLAMVAYHLTWDLGYFHISEEDWAATQIGKLAAHAIAMSFLALVGISLVLAQRGQNFMPKFWRRLAVIGAGAAAISLATSIFMPSEWIFFGILHCIFVVSLIGLGLLNAPLPLLIVASTLSWLLPSLVQGGLFNMPGLVWLGLADSLPRTNDFAPLFPSLAPMLAGMVLARMVLNPPEFANDNLPPAPPSVWRRALIWCGRHSLAIYLAHQPLLFGLFLALSNVIGTPGAEARFQTDCEQQCAFSGGEGPVCTLACTCVAQALKASGLWMPTLRGQLDKNGRGQLAGFAQSCGQKARTSTGGN